MHRARLAIGPGRTYGQPAHRLHGVAAPKSKNGGRDIPLSTALARELWTRQGAPDELIFTSLRGCRLDRDWLWKNVLRPTVKNVLTPTGKNVLEPTAKAAGVPWVGFHTFRHTCASVLFAEGRNPKQVQMWFGHSGPGFGPMST